MHADIIQENNLAHTK